MPTYETMQKINQRIRDDLDETKTSLTQLQAEHQAELGENAKLADAAKLAAERVVQLQQDLADLKSDHNATLAQLEHEKAALADLRAATEKQRSDETAATRAAKLKAIAWVGGFALLCIAGAVWSPVFKDKFAIFAAVLGLVAAGIWYLQLWHVIVGFSVVALGVIGRMVYLHNRSDKTVIALTGYLHEKGQLADADLQAWMTKYVKQHDGTVTAVPDRAVADTVTAALTSTNKL